MKVSLNTIHLVNKLYGSAGDPAPDGTDKLVENIGAQLAAVEEVVPFGKQFGGILIVKVVKCESHGNAEKLKICLVDDGGKDAKVKRNSDGNVQIVCGAPNVHVGMLAAWIPPGVTVPSTLGKEPLVMEARDIRGQTSNGMLASLHELGIGDDHSGILEVDVDIKPGATFVEAYNLVDEAVIEMENKMFTHRPDCFGQLGIARELEGIQQRPYKSPDWYKPNPTLPDIEADELKLEVQNNIPELVPRFVAVAMSGVEIKPSPVWLQILLAEVGIKSINNVVDYTNFFMFETGQPLHAYDYDKVKALDDGSNGATIVIRHPKEGEKLKLLGNKEIVARKKDIMIASASQLIGLGGVMGGSGTEVDANTKNIILECANFDMYTIRRTAMEHGIFTDSVTRFTKGQSPLQNLAVLVKIVDEICQHAGGKVASRLIDDNHVSKDILSRESIHPAINITSGFINDRLGEKLSVNEIAKLLTNVEFDVQVSGDGLTVTAPFWRTDIEIPEDIVEEVGRLYGYDHLPLTLPIRPIKPAELNPELEIKQRIRDILSATGANEVLTYSFVHGDLLSKVGQNKDDAFELSNALSPDLQYYRLSLIPSLLDKVHANIKQGYSELALFEMNPVHAKDFIEKDGIPRQDYRLAFVFAADDKAAQNHGGAAFYQTKRYLTHLLTDLGIDGLVFEEVTESAAKPAISQAAIAPFEPKRSAIVKTSDGAFIGELGEFRSSVRKNLKLPQFIAGFELDLKQLLKLSHRASAYKSLSRYPKVEQDITLKIASDVTYQQLHDLLHKQLAAIDNAICTLKPLDIYQKDSDSKNVSFRLSIASYEQTLTSEQVNQIFETASNAAKTELGAVRI